MFYIFLGPPGSGKGTQAQQLASELKLHHLSTGQLMREQIAAKTPLGLEIKELIESGSLIDDEMTFKILRAKIDNISRDETVILDGYPRTFRQAELLSDYAKKTGNYLLKVVYFDIKDDDIISRLSGRYSCKKCGAVYHKDHKPTRVEGICDYCDSSELQVRNDDKAEVVRDRLVAYHKETKPLVSYYEAQRLLIKIDAQNDLNLIHDELVKLIEAVSCHKGSQ